MKGALAVCWRDVLKFARQPIVMVSTIVGPFLTLILLGSAFRRSDNTCANRSGPRKLRFILGKFHPNPAE